MQDIFSANWGLRVTAVPRLEVHQPLLAFADGQAAGVALLNRRSGNIDLGVQVLEGMRRRRGGSALVAEALRHYRSSGFDHMYVIRSVPLAGLRESDEVALRLCSATGATRLREYTGFRLESGRA